MKACWADITLLPRHHYDPDNLLQRVTVKALAQDPAKLPPEAKQFGENFNKNYNRNPLGSGPYKFNGWKTGSDIELIRHRDYWGNGKKESINPASIA